MSRIAALGDRHRIQGFAIAGVDTTAGKTGDGVVGAWRRLPPDVAVLILTPEAAAALADRLDERPDLLVAVLP